MEIKRLPQKIELKVTRDFGYIIQKMRKECGLSQKELAQKIGLKSGTAICLWEANKRQVSAVQLWQVACVCGYSLELKEVSNLKER
ncbi:MAG TPA: XRE family transcriptional regulator [Candidatus Scalindua sp.]|nr:XRE family transcriptional regulator [Candidatus Scalindua sp.]